MFSVLIPTYNYKCYSLVSELQQQLELSHEKFEVIVAEDGGKDQVVAISNLRINELPHCRFIRRQENMGRSAIRNFLVSEAKGEWLLMMDSDGIVCKDDFIQKYLDARSEGANVICGGITHPDKCPSKEQSLRWKYEKNYERKHGNISDEFRSFCFMIKKEVFNKVKFNENYRMYGWEDVQFGIDLKEQGFTIKSINNPLQNGDIEENRIFLKKTEEALHTLKTFKNILKDNVLLLRTVEKLKKRHLAWLVTILFRTIKPLLRQNLSGKSPCLNAFAFYKLGYYLTNTDNNQ